MNIIQSRENRFNGYNDQDLHKIAKKSIWKGMQNYLNEKTSPVDAYSDIYYMTYALVTGILSFVMQETQDINSPKRALGIIQSAIMNAVHDRHTSRTHSNNRNTYN